MTDRVFEEDVETPADEAVAKSGRRKKLVLLIAAPVLALVIVGALLWATGLLKTMLGAAEEPPPAQVKPAVFLELPDLLVNLNATGRKSNFLKMSVSLELENEQDLPAVKAVLPRIVDNFQVYLRELRIEDLRGAAGMYRLREELLARVNAAAAPAKVTDVLFKEMLVQ